MTWLRDLLSTANSEALGFALLFYGGIALVVLAAVLGGVVLFYVLR
jgi:hypothetical protein